MATARHTMAATQSSNQQRSDRREWMVDDSSCEGHQLGVSSTQSFAPLSSGRPLMRGTVAKEHRVEVGKSAMQVAAIHDGWVSVEVVGMDVSQNFFVRPPDLTRVAFVAGLREARPLAER
jgi:hypothetical protein